MADSSSLKVMCIFEAGNRLGLGAEITCLAAHIYHRFFRIKIMSQFDQFTFAAASMKLAHWFYERDYDLDNICLVMNNILHGQSLFLNKNALDRVKWSIKLAAKVICTNLDYQINFKDTRFTTPGALQEQFREHDEQHQINTRRPIIINLSDEEDESSSLSDDEGGLTKAELLLNKIEKSQIGSHRYLVHYLKTIDLLIEPEMKEYFEKISNLAWIMLSDYYWSPSVTQIYANHLACACLIMAIEIYRPKLETSRQPERKNLWHILDKRWNLILCDDFPTRHLNRAVINIVVQYNEYKRVMQHELNTYVIDPLRR